MAWHYVIIIILKCLTYTLMFFFISQKMWMARRTYKKKFLYRSQAKKKMKMRRKFQSVLENQREKQVIFLDMSSHCVTWKNLGMISSEKNISFLDIFLWWVCMKKKAIFIHKKRSVKSSMCINMNWMYSKIKFHDIKLPFIIQQVLHDYDTTPSIQFSRYFSHEENQRQRGSGMRRELMKNLFILLLYVHLKEDF